MRMKSSALKIGDESKDTRRKSRKMYLWIEELAEIGPGRLPGPGGRADSSGTIPHQATLECVSPADGRCDRAGPHFGAATPLMIPPA